jgi:hypothetical protein
MLHERGREKLKVAGSRYSFGIQLKINMPAIPFLETKFVFCCIYVLFFKSLSLKRGFEHKYNYFEH